VHLRPPLAPPPAEPSKPLHEPLRDPRPDSRTSPNLSIRVDTPRNIFTDNNERNSMTGQVPASCCISASGSSLAAREEGALPLEISSSELSQSTFTDLIDADNRPPTSSSFSSQGRTSRSESHSPVKKVAPVAETNSQNSGSMQFTSQLNNGVASWSSSRSPTKVGSGQEPARGHKRTATGELKPASSVFGAQCPSLVGIRGHSRTMSADSNESRIAEVSTPLRTCSRSVTGNLSTN
jgi:hypothetical protein